MTENELAKLIAQAEHVTGRKVVEVRAGVKGLQGEPGGLSIPVVDDRKLPAGMVVGMDAQGGYVLVQSVTYV